MNSGGLFEIAEAQGRLADKGARGVPGKSIKDELHFAPPMDEAAE